MGAFDDLVPANRSRSQRPLVHRGPEREPPPQTPNQDRLTGAQAQRTAAEAMYAEQKARADALKAEHDARTAGADATIKEGQVQSRQGHAAEARAELQRLIDRIDRIGADASDNSGWGETGWTGSVLRNRPGTAAFDLAADIETLDASAAFKALQKMREQSPTGGALGAITERELDLLKATISNVDPNQSHESFLRQLGVARQAYADMLSRLPSGEPAGGGRQRREEQPPAFGALGGQPPQGMDRGQQVMHDPSGDAQNIELAGDAPFRSETDPTLRGLAARVNEMLKQRKSARDVALFIKSAGGKVDAQSMRRLLEIEKWNKEHPDYRGDYDTRAVERVWVPQTGARRLLNNIGQSAPGAYAINAADSLTLGTLDNMTENPELTRAGMAGVRAQHPYASLAGTVTGGALTAAGAEKAAAATLARLGAGRFAPQVAPRLGDALFGAGYGAGSADEGDRLTRAVTGAFAGAAGGEMGRRAAGGLGRLATGTRDTTTRFLQSQGIPQTIGQIAGKGGVAGGAIRKIEDTLESVPVLGAAITRRKAEGVEGFNRAAFREALEPIPPATVSQIAEEGVEEARGAVSGAYTDALSAVDVPADRVFVRDMKRAMAAGGKLHPDTAEDFARLVQNEVAEELANGRLTGEGFQTLRRILREERAAWKGKPRGRQYGQALRQLEGTLESLVRRRAPGVVQALNRADAANKGVSVVRDAVGRGKNTGGIFTPAQLGMAAERNAKKYGGTNATTQRPFFELQRAGQDVLPSSVPNSGTADRLMTAAVLPALPGIVGAGAASQGWISPEQAGLMAALGLPYTKAGMATFQKILISRPEIVRQAGEKLIARKPIGGLLGAGAGVAVLPAQ